MQLMTSTLAVALLALLPVQAAEYAPPRLSKRAATAYTLQTNMQTPMEFISHFNFFTQPDPSGGSETYVDRTTAHSLNMTGTGKNGGFRFGAETKQVGATRKSVRLESNTLYGLGMYIFDVQHMPVGCGTWPALWSYTNNTWPYGGEIDIVEGGNGITGRTDEVSLHSGPNCVMPASKSMTGTMIRNDCNSANGANQNQGCTIETTANLKSYGVNFNANGGGVYAMQRTTSAINIWFWSHNAAPAGTKRGDTRTIQVSQWGNPAAAFPFSSSCTADHFDYSHKLVMNLAFCGGLVAGVWTQDGCGSSASQCPGYIANNLKDANGWYWDVNRLSIWK